MDPSCFTMPYLESLSTGELMSLAEKCGLDIPQGLDRIFIIEELLYLTHNDGDAGGEPEDIKHREFEGLAALPRHYNVSFIEVIVRDPLWAFVFWELKEHDRKLYQSSADFDGYCLRVIPLAGDTSRPDMAASFTVAVNAEDSGWYVGFPADDGRCFKIELCVLQGQNCTVLAESRPFVLPRLIRPGEQDIQSVYQNPLVQLSGVDRFSLVHSEDRVPRNKGI